MWRKVCSTLLVLVMGTFLSLYRLLGKGLFTIIDNEEWKPQRKIYDPAFNRGYEIVYSQFNLIKLY